MKTDELNPEKPCTNLNTEKEWEKRAGWVFGYAEAKWAGAVCQVSSSSMPPCTSLVSWSSRINKDKIKNTHIKKAAPGLRLVQL